MGFSDALRLIFQIDADSKGAEAEIKRVTGAVDSLSSRAISDLTGRMGAAGTVVDEFAAGIAKLPTSTLAAAGAVAALGTAAIVASGAVLSLTKQAAEYGSTIYDASQKTGLTTTSIAALKYAAEQAGSSFEQVIKGVTNFGVELGKAALGDEKAKAKMDSLNVSSLDLDQALAQVFETINNGATDTDKMALAAEAFGKKIGPDLVPLIKDADGNFQKLIDTVKELGLDVTPEAAKAADAYGDSMDTLHKQLEAVRIKIGTDLIPVVLNLSTEFSNFLTKNQKEVTAWSLSVANAVQRVVLSFEEEKNDLEAIGEILDTLNPASNKTWDDIGSRMEKFTLESARIRIARENLAKPLDKRTGMGNVNDQFSETGTGYIPPTRTPTGDIFEDNAKKKAEADKAAADARKKALDLAKRDFAAATQIAENALRQLDQDFDDTFQKMLDQFNLSGNREAFKKDVDALIDYYNTRRLDAAALADKLETQQAKKAGATKNELLLLQDKQTDRQVEMSTRIQNAREQAETRDREIVKRQAKDADKKEKDDKKRLQDNFESIVDEGERVQSTLEAFAERDLAVAENTAAWKIQLAKGNADKIKAIEDELSAYRQKKELDLLRFERTKAQALLGSATTEEQREKIKAAVLALDLKIETVEAQNATNALKRGAARRADDIATWNQSVQIRKDIDDRNEAARVQAEDEAFRRKQASTIGSGGEESEFAKLQKLAISEENTNALIAIDAMQQAFAGLASAIGDVVQAWVLYGSAGQSVRKVTAQILAGIAQQAAVQAVFQLAEGFAALAQAIFFNDPKGYASATTHFLAAAKYGIVAGIAAVAGRSVAGNSFQQQTATATGSGRSTGANTQGSQSTSAGAYSGQEDQVIDVSRNTPEATGPTIIIKDKTGMMGKLLEWEIQTNSGVRKLIVDTANS